MNDEVEDNILITDEMRRAGLIAYWNEIETCPDYFLVEEIYKAMRMARHSFEMDESALSVSGEADAA